MTQHGDDGVTQQITAKTGIKLENVPVPNPVRLAAFRTFREVEQPESVYVLRLRRGPKLPQVALFIADGDAWKLEAMTRVFDFLKGALPEGTRLIV